MATVNYSVPSEVKRDFDATFEGENKSAIIARLMRRAVEERRLEVSRRAAIDRLLELREQLPRLSGSELERLRHAGRP